MCEISERMRIGNPHTLRQMDESQIECFMKAALLEGRKAISKCSPNPPVGCVIVKDGFIAAAGHTNEPGQDHAEAMALRQLPEDLSDYVAFVTLEPCSFHGRTPSCAEALAERNIGHVFVALIDSDPRNNGKGIEILRQRGISVTTPVLEELARSQLGPYLAKT